MGPMQPTRRFSARGVRLLVLLGLWLGGAAPLQAQGAIPERIIWHNAPIALVLAVGQERR